MCCILYIHLYFKSIPKNCVTLVSTVMFIVNGHVKMTSNVWTDYKEGKAIPLAVMVECGLYPIYNH